MLIPKDGEAVRIIRMLRNVSGIIVVGCIIHLKGFDRIEKRIQQRQHNQNGRTRELPTVPGHLIVNRISVLQVRISNLWYEIWAGLVSVFFDLFPLVPNGEALVN